MSAIAQLMATYGAAAPVQVDLLNLTDATTEYYGGTNIAGIGDGIQLPPGWRYQTVYGATNKPTILRDHAAPAWIDPASNIHTTQAEFLVQNSSPEVPGFHAGVVSRHPGVNYTGVGGNRSSACIWGSPKPPDAYQFALENIEFGTAGTPTRDPWYSAKNTVNNTWTTYVVHTRWRNGESHSKAQAFRANGNLIDDSGWQKIPASAWGDFSDLSRKTCAIFHVSGNDEAYAFRNVKSAWRNGDSPISLL